MPVDLEPLDKAHTPGVVHFRQWSFAKREILLAGVALFLLVFCLIFIGLYGHAESERSQCDKHPSVVVGQHYCVNQSCLQTASRTLRLMNRSVDPCEDFYHYACGNYKNVKTASYGEDIRNIFQDVHMDNEKKLIEILEKPIDRGHQRSSERKLKEFFQSCTDMYSREKLLGKPFLEKVVPVLGGWDLLGTWKQSEWDLNTVLKIVQADFLTKSLYEPMVRVDRFNSTLYAIELHPAGTGQWMTPEMYESTRAQTYQADYEKFIRRVGSLLMRDSEVTFDTDTRAAKLDQLVDDILTMEITIINETSINLCPSSYFEKVTLDDLNTESGHVINWVEQLSYLLNDTTLTGSSLVVVKCRVYFQNISTIISNLPDKDRILHNYLIWRVAETYVQEMSWEYMHANREIAEDIYGYTRYSSVHRYCFDQMGSYMSDALGALFISDHFFETNRRQVQDITEHLKTVLQEQLDQTPWMDSQTKAYAKDKLDATTFKMGYPDWMANHESVDSLYDGLTVTVPDYFGNVLSANGFVRSVWSRELRRGEDRHRWTTDIYNTYINSVWYWNEIIAPAGLLQDPIYDYTQPHYKTFGSLGGIFGRYLHHVVDDYGKYYNKEGNYMGPDTWWTEKSSDRYESVRGCVSNFYTSATRDLTNPDGTPRDVIVYPTYARLAISTINGVRLAMKAYRKWVSERGIAEKMLPGMDLTDDQMVFLSYAQVQCYQHSRIWSVVHRSLGILEEDLQVNLALSQLPEFSEAFKCKETAKMNAEKKCDYY